MVTARREDNRRKATEHEQAPALISFWLPSFIGIALTLLLAATLLVYFLEARDEQDGRRQLVSGTGVLAKSVASELTRVRGVLDAWRGDADLRAAFLSRRPEALKAKESDLLARLPGAMGIHLFAPEQTSSVEGIPFMSYAGLDLARQAAQELAVTQIEIHKVAHPDMHLAIAAPVLSQAGDRAVGVVHVALPISLLPSPAGVVGDRGAVLYQQVVGDTVATLGATGEEPQGEPKIVQPIPGTRLRVAGWLRNPGHLDPWLLAEVGGAYLILLALIGLALWLAYSALRRAIIMDYKGLTALIDDAVSCRPVRNTKTRIAEAQRAHQDIFNLLRGLEPSRASLRGAATAASSSSEQPAQSLASRDNGFGRASRFSDSSIEVEEVELPDAFDAYAAPSAQPLPVSEPSRRSSPDAFDDLDDLDDIVALESREPVESADPVPEVEVPPEVFGVGDIRGIAERQLSAEAMRAIGQALGSEAVARGDSAVLIGRDCRASGPALSAALAEGIRASGADAVDLGVVPTPLVYFACCHPEPLAGAMVTAGDSPPQYNGIKLTLGGQGADAETIQTLRQRIQEGRLGTGDGGMRTLDAVRPYREYVERDLTLARSLKLAIDCGNATASAVAPDLFRAIGCEVIELNCDMNAGLADPMPDLCWPEDIHGLGELVRARGADIGLAFDGDGSRLGVVDSEGRFIPGDRVLMLLAADVLTRHPGSDVVLDVKCSRYLADEIRRAGGRPTMVPSGHAPLKAKARETGAPIAGGLSGRIVFRERWFGFDDAIYAGARLLEVLSLDPRTTQDIFAALPGGLATPELAVPLPEGEPARVMRSVMQLADRLDGVDVIRIDGLRAQFSRGWGLVRASNTESKLVFRFEGDDQESLDRIQALYRRIMDKAAPGLPVPF